MAEKTHHSINKLADCEPFVEQDFKAFAGKAGLMSKHEVTGSGRLREEGAPVLDEEVKNTEGPDEIYDESGNKILVKKKMQAKDIKKEIKDIEKKLKENKKKNTLSEEDVWEIGDRLAELQSMLEAS